ncbi:hypothetical protein M0R45_007189 [Rubus argutus]|uniref:Uncharacterized protein n=1 Tax=Rubus argutus TaxID=59490 RepID=A0AAW1YTH0_RUBAR
MSDSLVRVSRRAEWGARRPSPGARRCRSTPRWRVLPSMIASTTSPRAYQQPGLLAAAAIRTVHTTESIGGPACHRSTSDRAHRRPPIRFPPRQFQALFDSLFKVLSSFPRGTCLLSDYNLERRRRPILKLGYSRFGIAVTKGILVSFFSSAY